MFLWIVGSLCVENTPASKTNCSFPQFLSWYSFSCDYECTSASDDVEISNGMCLCSDKTQRYDVISKSCVSSADCSDKSDRFCYRDGDVTDARTILGIGESSSLSLHARNLENQEKSRTIPISLNEYADAALSCYLSKEPSNEDEGGFRYDMKSCQKIANLWASVYYSPAKIFDTTIEYNPGSTSSHGYNWWPKNVPFVWFINDYEHIMSSNYITSTFNYESVMTFQLAKFSKDGTFIGFKELTFDITQCGEKSDVDQIWRQWGTNYYSKCNFNLGNAIHDGEDVMYDLFFEDGDAPNGEGKVLRPVPVLVWNYVDAQGNMPNTKDDESRWKLGRRFFMANNLGKYVQYATNISIELRIHPDDTRKMLPPLLRIKYAETSQTNAVPDSTNINFDETTSKVPEFTFNVMYTRDMSGFWRTAVIILIIFLVFGFILWLFQSIVYARNHKNDGTVMLYFLGSFCSTMGSVIGLVVFVVSFFSLFIFYKWQKTGYICLPPESEFSSLSIFVWVAFGLTLIGSIVEIVIHARQTIFFIDWDGAHKEGVPVSAWRRLMVANSWNRLSTTRSYSIELTLIFMLFVLEGFDVQLLASPIPRSGLIDVGKTYKILRFAFSAFLWMLFIAFEYFISTLGWTALGSPFLNFIDLCSISNNSVLIMETPSSGFYIHGRSVHAHADEDMVKLNENLCAESNGMIGFRGLVPNTENQVFRVYLTQDFSYSLQLAFSSIEERFGRKAIASAKQRNSRARIEVEIMGAYDPLNKSLKKFLEVSEGDKKYIVGNATLTEKLIGWAPQVNTESVFTVQSDNSFKKTLMYGIQWTLSTMYLLLFCGVEIESQSPAIAAFVVYFTDVIIRAIFRKISRLNLSKKAVVDRHFILQ